MNMKFTNLIVAVPLTLAAGAAYAQSASQYPQTSQGTQGNMASPQQTPPYQSRTPPPAGTSGSQGNMPAGSAPPTPFDSLDTSHQGYLTRQNAATDSWLASHFAQCDPDRDGRVTRAEYTACSGAQP